MTTVRYQCRACGNLTRFDVVISRRTKVFYHYSVGGELTIEDEEILFEEVEEVSCRWCGNGGMVDQVEEGGLASSAPPVPEPSPERA